MANKLTLYLIKGKKTKYDISELLINATWGGQKGSACRTLEFTLINDKNIAMAGIDIEQGNHVIYKINNDEAFRGIILRQEEDSSNKTITCKAYDVGVYLSNNTDTFVIKNKTASGIFLNVCKRYNIPVSSTAKTPYIIKSHIQESKKAWDCLLSALSKTYKHTGIRYYIRADKGKLSLSRRSKDVVNLIIETGANVQAYKRVKSYENVVTRIKMYDDKNKFKASSWNVTLESVIGVFQDVISYNKEKNKGQLSKYTRRELMNRDKVDNTLTLTVNGDKRLISGRCVNVIIRPLNISRKYYIDSDTHSFNDSGGYSTQLTLNVYDEKEWS